MPASITYADQVSGGEIGRRLVLIVQSPEVKRATAMDQRCSSRSGSGACAIRVPGLGPECLDDDFLQMAEVS